MYILQTRGRSEERSIVFDSSGSHIEYVVERLKFYTNMIFFSKFKAPNNNIESCFIRKELFTLYCVTSC